VLGCRCVAKMTNIEGNMEMERTVNNGCQFIINTLPNRMPAVGYDRGLVGRWAQYFERCTLLVFELISGREARYHTIQVFNCEKWLVEGRRPLCLHCTF